MKDLSVGRARKFVEIVLDGFKKMGVKISHSKRDVQESTQKYSDDPNRLDAELWESITLETDDPILTDFIFAQQHALSYLGIEFDSGTCGNKTNWELDWSFEVAHKDEEGSLGYRNAINIVKDIRKAFMDTEEETKTDQE